MYQRRLGFHSIVCHSVGCHSVSKLSVMSQTVDQLVNNSVGWLVSLVVGGSVGWSVCWSVGLNSNEACITFIAINS